ncbi:hypothetical protein POM88_012450 [Heracleum sosnowskyi]|uniref:Uncharacterized protein n=1 Tax=Heracleum sosnowskyi TaxID=360622 RepID=A0AAD8N1R5_9APIA|nr:hypothetical protein POM88_012450 [Heracleum sosnowskyi]
MSSEPKCSETPLTIDEFEEMVATEFDEELLRELLEEPQVENDICAKPTQPGTDVDSMGKNEAHINNVHEFDWSELTPKEGTDTNMCSVEDYCDEFVELGNSGEYYSPGYGEGCQDETTYVGLW